MGGRGLAPHQRLPAAARGSSRHVVRASHPVWGADTAALRLVHLELPLSAIGLV